MLGKGLTYVHVELALKEFKGDYLSSGKGDVGRSHALPEDTKVFVQLPHVVRASWSPEVVLGILVPFVHPIQGEAVKQRRILIVLAHLDEFPLPIFVGLLEDRED